MVRVLLTVQCTDSDARVEETLLQADLDLPSLFPELSLRVYETIYPTEQIQYVVEKGRYQITLANVVHESWKTCVKRIEELMHAGFKVKIFPVLHDTEEQAKSAIFAHDVAGNRLTAMRINGQWHTLRDVEKFWIKFRSESVIFVPLSQHDFPSGRSDVHPRQQDVYETSGSSRVS